MKRTVCIFLCIFFVLCFGCTAESSSLSNDNNAVSPEPEAVTITEPDDGSFLKKFGYDITWIGPKAYGIVSCKDGDFSTLVSFPMYQETEESGIFLSLDTSAMEYPLIEIYRPTTETVPEDLEKFLNEEQLPFLQASLGDNLVSSKAAEEVSIGNHQLWQVEIEYSDPETKVPSVSRFLCGLFDDALICFSVHKHTEDNDAVYTYLEEAVTNFKIGANAYSE